LKPHEPVESPL